LAILDILNDRAVITVGNLTAKISSNIFAVQQNGVACFDLYPNRQPLLGPTLRITSGPEPFQASSALNGKPRSFNPSGSSVCYPLNVKLCLTIRHLVCINTHMDSWVIIKMLQKNGWYKAGQSGSHIQFRHPSKKGRVTVPHPKKDIPIGTLRSIERQSGIKFK